MKKLLLRLSKIFKKRAEFENVLRTTERLYKVLRGPFLIKKRKKSLKNLRESSSCMKSSLHSQQFPTFLIMNLPRVTTRGTAMQLRIFYDRISFSKRGTKGESRRARGETDIRCKSHFLMWYRKKTR